MRHQYTPIFRDLLTSSIWITDPATRCVWIWMLLSADPEGFVCGTLPGIANGANVSLDQAKAALELLESPDPYSSTKAMHGVRAVKVERGWHLVNFVARREMAKDEAEKARKRRWAEANRKRGKQLPLPGYAELLDAHREMNDIFVGDLFTGDLSGCSGASTVAGSSETVDAPKPIPKPKPKEEGSGSPLPPVGEISEEVTFDAPVLHRVVRKLSEVTIAEPMLDALRAEAQLAGLSPEEFLQRLGELGRGPIGGARGVFAEEVPDYIRAQFPKWRTWAETDRMKAQRDAEAPPSRRFGGAPAEPAPTPRERAPGYPEWVYAEHAQLAAKLGLDLKRAVRAFAKQAPVNPNNMRPIDVLSPFAQFLENLGRERGAA